MRLTFIPSQSAAAELLDSPDVDPALLQRNLGDMALANRWLGAERAVVRQVGAWVQTQPVGAVSSVLDIGTGNAGLLRQLHAWGRQHGRTLQLIGCDVSAAVLGVAQQETAQLPVALVQCNALDLPLGDNAVDIVTCVQALHHLNRDAAIQVLHECVRVARVGVFVSDLRRSYVAYWGARLLGWGPVSPLSRHDGPLSVLRAYTPQELDQMVQQAQMQARIMQRGWRVDLVISTGDPARVQASR